MIACRPEFRTSQPMLEQILSVFQEMEGIDTVWICVIGSEAACWGRHWRCAGISIEFMDLSEIRHHYGEDGLTDLLIDPLSGKALFSDDTQMTLFTASGLLTLQCGYEAEESAPS